MNLSSFSRLPLGVSDFHKLRETGKIYVDKTELIYQLASERGQFLFTRPRRFGKSLLISKFESLFKNGLRDFSGLAIENKWKDRTYQVIRLDFSNIKDFSSEDELLSLLNEYLFLVMKRSGIEVGGLSTAGGLTAFFEWLSGQPDNSLVVLIDEYDAPLTACLENLGFFNFAQKILSDFFEELHRCRQSFRFLFITGIVRFNPQILFSSYEYLTDISLSPEYGELVGFTKKELLKFFPEKLRNTAKELNLPASELLEKLEKEYGGFCFEETASQKVLSTWSVLSFLSEPDRGFKPYWIESGGGIKNIAQFLMTDLGPERFDEPISIELNGLRKPDKLSAVDVLTQAGYFTLKAIQGHIAKIGHTNEEIRRSFAQFYTFQLLGGKTIEQVGAENIANVLSTGDRKAFYGLMSKLFDSINYQSHPIKNRSTLTAFTRVFLESVGVGTTLSKRRGTIKVESCPHCWSFKFIIYPTFTVEAAQVFRSSEANRKKLPSPGQMNNNLVVLIFSQEKKKLIKTIY